MGCVYKATSKTTGKSYIGKSINFKNRLRRHKSNIFNKASREYYTHFANAVRIYGWNDFEWIIIYDNIPNNQLDNMEKFAIANYNTYSSDGLAGYNSTTGGEGATEVSKDTIEKIVKAHKGTKHSKETRKKMSEAKIGIKFSEKHRKNLSIARRKRKTSDETKKKLSRPLKGKINIKKFKLISPNGIEYITTRGLTLFCEQHKIYQTGLYRAMRCGKNEYKGWKIFRLSD